MTRSSHSRLYTDVWGFSLIEVLVVVPLIGILAAIALPLFIGQKSKGQDAEAKSNGWLPRRRRAVGETVRATG